MEKELNAEIISVGTELLLGDILNTNAQFLSGELAKLGVNVFYQTVVGDNRNRLKAALETAFSRAGLVITTGGLGPTEDDLTKETCAEYFCRGLVLDKSSLTRIRGFFRSIDREMTENNVKQAFVPEGCIVLENNNGTAPGCIIEENGKILVMLPGPPHEAIAMFNESVKPFLEKKTSFTLVSRTLLFSGIGESELAYRLRDLLENQTNPSIAPYAKPAGVTIRITAKAHNKNEAEQLIAPVSEEIYRRLGAYIYGEDNERLEEAVVRRLCESGLTIACAESCTGGLLTAALVSVPGVSAALIEGDVTYSNEAKVRRLGVSEKTLAACGAVSHETAREMAAGAAREAGTDIGISTTGIAGPDGGSKEKPVGLVYIGLFVRGKVSSYELRLTGGRRRIRERAVNNALACLLKELNNTTPNTML